MNEYLSRYAGPRQPEEDWDPVSAAELHKAAQKQKGKAGGTDTWTGSELSVLPKGMWHGLAKLLQRWEALGTFPTVWQEVRQTHIPKPGSNRQKDQAKPAGKLRPISLLSAWWRTYISARLQTAQAQEWANRHVPAAQAGGRKHRDAAATFMTLASAYATGHFMASLDLAKAFDHARPVRALEPCGGTVCLAS